MPPALFALDQHDPDRWLALLFAPAAGRRCAAAVLAFAHEVASAQERAREPGLHAIRIQWWRDAIAEMFDGRPVRRHEVVIALAEAVAQARLPRGPFDALLDARNRDGEDAPFATAAELDAYLAATAGGAAALAAKALAPACDLASHTPLFDAVGRAWGRAGLLRALPVWAGRRRVWFPAEETRALDLEATFAGRLTPGLSDLIAAHAGLVARDVAEVRRLSAAAPAEAFPAFAYVALAPTYARAVRRLADPFRTRVDLSPLDTRVRLVWATLMGRV